MTTTSNPTSANIARWVTERAATDPDLPALRQGEQILTYSDLETASARFATILRRHGVEPGDRIAMIMPNVAYFPIVYYAILRVGAIVVPMNPLLKAGEISFVWNDCSVKIAVVFPLFAEEAAKAASLTGTETILTVPGEFDAELARTDPTEEVAESTSDETAVILYTSGTTGQPKGAELTDANLSSNAHTMIETLIPMGPGDMVFGGLPLFHSFGQLGLNAAMAGGACMTLLSKFDGEQALSIVSSDRVTVFAGVPTMYMGLLAVKNRERFDTSALRAAVSGGASLPVEVLHRVEQAFGITLLEGYGLSETSPVASFNHPDRPTKPGSIGTPIRGVEFGLRDEDDKEVTDGEIGEIVIRGENVMKGYWNKPEATAEAMRGGWFHSGDLARRDEDGYYFIVDRKKDMINRSGFKVYPREVEEILYAHPAVAEAAVFGVPDAMCGEEVAALVTLKDGASATESELREYVKERIAAYKYPRIIRFGPIPKGPTGKILKREIKFEG
jgi:long-chain acyl-CoA synthetase